MKKFFSELEDNICAIILFIMLVLTCVNVVARYVFLASMPFVEELTCVGLVALSLSGAAVAAKRGAHLGLTVLTDLFSKRGQKVCQVLGDLLGIGLGALIAYYGYLMTKQEFFLKQLTAGMQWPEWLFGIVVPISGVILVIRYAQLFIRNIKEIR